MNFFKELTIQKRIEDSWYGELMEECRYGRFSEESYNFLVGLPTTHAGSWRVDGTMECGKAECAALPEQWKRMADEGLHGQTCRHWSAQCAKRNATDAIE